MYYKCLLTEIKIKMKIFVNFDKREIIIPVDFLAKLIPH